MRVVTGKIFEEIGFGKIEDKLHSTQKERVQQISYRHIQKTLNNNISIVFYDVTTLYVEIDQDDELRKTGFNKEGKHQHLQIVLGLLVSVDGYPLTYDIFEGNKFEGHTMLLVISTFKEKYSLQQLVIIVDSGLLSNDNLTQLHAQGYKYIFLHFPSSFQDLQDETEGS